MSPAAAIMYSDQRNTDPPTACRLSWSEWVSRLNIGIPTYCAAN